MYHGLVTVRHVLLWVRRPGKVGNNLKGFAIVRQGFVGFGKNVSFVTSLVGLVLNAWYGLLRCW